MKSPTFLKLLSTLGLLTSSGLLAAHAQAYNCSNVSAYQAGTSYATGAIVQNAGTAYSCTVGGWCTVGGPYAPGTGWAWTNAWSSLGACSGSGQSSVAPSSAAPSSVASSAASSVVTQTSSAASSVAVVGCNGLTAWSSTAVYTGGNQVARNGVKYQAKWWTQGQDPLTNSSADGVWLNQGACSTSSAASVVSSVASSVTTSAASSVASSAVNSVASSSVASSVSPVGGKKVVGYFAEWGVYGRNYHVKNIATSGSAAQLTHILYSFGNVQNGRCTIGDAYAAYEKAYDAAGSVDGVADTWDQPVRGNFNQLRKLKQMYPGLKVIWSFGGWTWSDGFPQAAQNPTLFAESCYNLVEDPRWADVFDGIDIDWEYPNECGLKCDTTSGFSGYKNLMQALRARFGDNNLLTSAIGAGAAKLNAADYAGAAQYVDFYMPMTYDFFGAWDKTGPTAPHSALYGYNGIPIAGYHSDNAIQIMKAKGIPASKILLGVGFYGRGWTGVTQDAPGGSATGGAAGTYEAGIEDYKVLRNTCPATGTVGGTAYAKCGNNWWSYDTPQTLVGKMDYVHQEGLAGTFFWELSGDTSNGELIKVIGDSMR